jgi:hypothetical protein
VLAIGYNNGKFSLSPTYTSSGSFEPLSVFTSNLERFSVDSNGDISFYEDTGTTARFFWNASTERLGIGTSSPATAFSVVGDITTTGGVYLGGTGAANLLDDYEEGTWTPTLTTDGTDFTSVTYDALVSGTYTKVGRVVTVDGFMRTDAITKGSASGSVQIGGFPFSAVGVSIGNVGGTTAWLVNSPTNCQTSGAVLYLTYGANSTDFIAVTDVDTATNDNEIRFSVTYRTT